MVRSSVQLFSGVCKRGKELATYSEGLNVGHILVVSIMVGQQLLSQAGICQRNQMSCDLIGKSRDNGHTHFSINTTHTS